MSYILESIEIETLSNKDEDDNVLGSEYFLPSGEKIIAINTSQDDQITEFCSSELEQNKDSEVFPEGYVVILTDDGIKILENENNEIENFYTEEHSSDNQSNEKNKKVVVEAEFLCSIEGCNKRFGSVAQLKSHERRHGGVSCHECESCQKKFSTGYALKKHRRIHTGEKPYVCPEVICQKMFKTSGDFQKHLRTHTGERPFKCGICSKAFTTSNIRTVHMRVHTGEKPYECTYEGCEKKFSSATNFRNHVRIHTGEKPYECLVQNCRKRFTEYSSLYKHYAVHFQKKSYACSICHRRYRQFSTFKYHIKRSSCSQGKSKDDEICLTESDQDFLPPSSYNKDDDSHWASISFDSLKTINSSSEAVLVLAVPSDTDESSLQISEEKAQ